MLKRALRIPRNASLLVMLILLIVVAPVVPLEDSWFVAELIFDLILLAGVYSVGPGRHRWPFLVLTALTLTFRWGELLSGMGGLDITALALTVAWLSYALAIIAAGLFQARDVSMDTIFGAVVTYLLIAVAFAMVYQIVELLDPGAISGLPDGAIEDREQLTNSLVYFSLVCITTMGYGDLVPVSDLARPLAVMEGVLGQLYLTVMIARLVGLHVAHEKPRG